MQLEDRQLLAAITVGTAADLVDGDVTTISTLIANPGADGAISLREALTATDNTIGTDAITFDPATFNGEADDVIRLEQPLVIGEATTIDAGNLGVVVTGDRGGNDLLIAGTFITDVSNSGRLSDNSRQVFRVTAPEGSTVTFNGLTITGGASEYPSSTGGGVAAEFASLAFDNSVVSGNNSLWGAGIRVDLGSLTLIDSTVSGNVASSDGGGINSRNGDVVLTRSTVSNNLTGFLGSGGGIYSSNGDVVLNRSTVSNNLTGFSGDGGGIFSRNGTLFLTESTLSQNVAGGDGGGIYSSDGDVVLTRSTVSGNSADSGGGGVEVSDGAVTIIDSTITQNVSDDSFSTGGIQLSSFGQSQSLTVRNSIIAGNRVSRFSRAPADIASSNFIPANVDITFSLIGTSDSSLFSPSPVGSPDASGNFIGSEDDPIDPLLADLSNNGGPTQTHALLPGSLAINFGNSESTTDQRGELRPVGPPSVFGGDGSDIGAFELQALTFVVDSSSDLVDGDFSSGNLSLREAINLANATPGVDEILFDSSVFDGELNDVIRLQLGELQITGGVTIDGGVSNVVVSADSLGNDDFDPTTFVTDVDASELAGTLVDNSSRVFSIITAVGESVVLTNLTATGGNAVGGGGISVSSANLELVDTSVSGNRSSRSGGGILTDRALTLTDSTVSGNVVNGRGGGGGISAGSETVTLNRSTVSDNRGSSGGGIRTFGGDVVLDDSNVTGNTSFSGTSGGGVRTSSGNVTLNRSTVSGNESSFQGGGISTDSGSIIAAQSTISGNEAFREGGGISTTTGTVSISNSTLSGNVTTDRGGNGGGIFANNGDVTITTSTISGNSTTGTDAHGGGIFSSTGNVSLSDSTVTANVTAASSSGGGIYIEDTTGASALTVQNSIIAGNIAGVGSDLHFDLNTSLNIQFSLIGDNSGTVLIATTGPDANRNLIGSSGAVIDPLLGELSYNGGPTMTHAPLDGSPAIDVGSSVNAGDQRGLPYVRDDGNGTDIGAVETQELNLLVDTNEDIDNGDFSAGDLSLREAIDLANNDPGENLIRFSASQFMAAFGNTIRLTLGQLTITESLHIDGENLGVAISGDANRDDRVTFIPNGFGTGFIGTAITDLAETNDAQLDDNSGVLNITAVAGQVVTLSGLTISGGVSGDGGGIANAAADLVIHESTIAGNRALGSGGGLFNGSGSVTILRSTISGNEATGNDGSGGGIYAGIGAISLTSSTVSGNSALGVSGNGGGVSSSSGEVTLESVTITQNSSTSNGGGVFVLDSAVNPLLTIDNTIIADNDGTASPDLQFASDSGIDIRFSLIGDNSGTTLISAPVGSPDASGNLIGSSGLAIDPFLSDLADNGGLTLTHEPNIGSPVIDAGNSALPGDQRNISVLPRDNGGGVDIGALERLDLTLVVDTSSDVNDGDFSTGNLSLREALVISNANPKTDTITFDTNVFNGELSDVIRLQLGELTISDGVIIDGEETGVVISGDSDGDDVLVAGGFITDTFASEDSDRLADNVRVFNITATPTVDSTVAITGLTITGGSASEFGGGIRNEDGELLLTNVVVSGNRARSIGGGIYTDDGNLTLFNSNVNENSGTLGGGIFSRDGDVALTGTSVTGNLSASHGGGIYSADGLVALNTSIVEDNTTGSFGNGGGIYSDSGDVNLNESVVRRNTTGQFGRGGGILTVVGDLTLNDSSVSENTAGDNGDGGGIQANNGDITAIGSTISENQAGRDGGGIQMVFFNGVLRLFNSTVSGNRSGSLGGGIHQRFGSTIQVSNSTITNNQSEGDGGGIYIGSSFSSEILLIENSIVAGNTSLTGIGPDLHLENNNIATSASYSLIGSNASTPLAATSSGSPDANGNLIGTDGALVDARLGTLSDNGGLILTHELLAGSPAIDAGNPAFDASGPDGLLGTADDLLADQRGSVRNLNGRIDIGATESAIPNPQVTDVIVGSSSFTPSFIDAVDGGGIGTGNGLGYSLAGDHQLESVPWQNIETIYLQFTDDVSASLSDGDIILTGSIGGNYSLGPISYDTQTNIASVPILGGIERDSLVISIFESTVTDTSGLGIVNNAGEQFNFFFNVLPGDEDGSGQVNSVDAFNTFSSNTEASGPLNFRRDIDGSGQINSTDAFGVFANNTNGLPATPTPPTPPANTLASVSPVTAYSEIDAVFSEVLFSEVLFSETLLSEVNFAQEPLEPLPPTIKSTRQITVGFSQTSFNSQDSYATQLPIDSEVVEQVESVAVEPANTGIDLSTVNLGQEPVTLISPTIHLTSIMMVETPNKLLVASQATDLQQASAKLELARPVQNVAVETVATEYDFSSGTDSDSTDDTSKERSTDLRVFVENNVLEN